MKIYQVIYDRSDENLSSTIEAIILDIGDKRYLITHEGDSEYYFGIYLELEPTNKSVTEIFEEIKKDKYSWEVLKLVEVKLK